jgi:hypothetical protein
MSRHAGIVSLIVLTSLMVVACTLSLLRVPALPTLPVSTAAAALSPEPATTRVSPTRSPPAATGTAASIVPTAITSDAFCEDPAPRALIDAFKTAVLTSDGDLLGTLVSPSHGMDARLFRDGRVVNYDRPHASALFESSFQVNWGAAPGSGLETTGSFRELLLPDLRDVFKRDFALACNEIRVGGTTYVAAWPYAGIDFYSVYFPGSPAYDGLDWHTWLIGMDRVGPSAYLYAIMQFKWEP